MKYYRISLSCFIQVSQQTAISKHLFSAHLKLKAGPSNTFHPFDITLCKTQYIISRPSYFPSFPSWPYRRQSFWDEDNNNLISSLPVSDALHGDPFELEDEEETKKIVKAVRNADSGEGNIDSINLFGGNLSERICTSNFLIDLLWYFIMSCNEIHFFSDFLSLSMSVFLLQAATVYLRAIGISSQQPTRIFCR